MCVCVTVRCRKPDHSTHASKRGRGGSGEEEKCRVAVLVFPCDRERAAWAFQMSDVIRHVKAAYTGRTGQDGWRAYSTSILAGAVHAQISVSRRRNFDAHGNAVKMNQLEIATAVSTKRSLNSIQILWMQKLYSPSECGM